MENEYVKLAFLKALIDLLDHQTKIPKKVFLSSYFPGLGIDQQKILLGELKKNKLIKSFSWEDDDFAIVKPSRSGIIEFKHKLEKTSAKPKEVALTDTRLKFNEQTGMISMGGKTCPIPINTNQYFLCKTVFALPFGTLVKEIDILDLMDWAKDSKDSVYDAMREVNRKIKQKIGIEKLMQWKIRRIFIDYKTE